MISLVQSIAVELHVCNQQLDGLLFGTDLDIFVFIFS